MCCCGNEADIRTGTETPASMEFQNKEKQALSDELIMEIDNGNIKNAISNMYLNTLDKTKR